MSARKRKLVETGPIITFVCRADTHSYLVSDDGYESLVVHVANANDEEWPLLKTRPRARRLPGACRYAIDGTKMVATVQSGCKAPYGTSEFWTRLRQEARS